MARDTARKIETSPNLAHVDVVRNSAGTVQMTTSVQNTGNTQTGTATNTVGTTYVNDPGLVCFTSATIKGSGGGGGNTATLTLLRDGAAVATTSGTGAITTSISNTHTTPLNAPKYQAKVASNGGTATWTVTVKREKRW